MSHRMPFIFTATIASLLFLTGSITGFAADKNSDLLTRPWLKTQIGTTNFSFESPLELKADPLELTPDLTPYLAGADSMTAESEGFAINVSRLSYKAVVKITLEGAADGALDGIKTLEGVKQAEGIKLKDTFLGYKAYRIKAIVISKQDASSIFDLLIFLKDSDIYTFQFNYSSHLKAAELAWEKFIASIKETPKTTDEQPGGK